MQILQIAKWGSNMHCRTKKLLKCHWAACDQRSSSRTTQVYTSRGQSDPSPLSLLQGSSAAHSLPYCPWCPMALTWPVSPAPPAHTSINWAHDMLLIPSIYGKWLISFPFYPALCPFSDKINSFSPTFPSPSFLNLPNLDISATLKKANRTTDFSFKFQECTLHAIAFIHLWSLVLAHLRF